MQMKFGLDLLAVHQRRDVAAFDLIHTRFMNALPTVAEEGPGQGGREEEGGGRGRQTCGNTRDTMQLLTRNATSWKSSSSASPSPLPPPLPPLKLPPIRINTACYYTGTEYRHQTSTSALTWQRRTGVPLAFHWRLNLELEK